jgi:hypothetical protein
MGNWIIRYQSGSYYELVGVSTDDKPTDGIGYMSIAIEMDTAIAYYFDGTEWQVIGGNS